MSDTETYKLHCHMCHIEIEIHCDGPMVCGRCGTSLTIEWQAGRADIERSIPSRSSAEEVTVALG